MKTPTLFRLEGKVAIVTGAAGMLGREHAAALAECGANLVLVDLNEGECKAVAASVARQCSVGALGLGGDVAQRRCWEDVSDVAQREFGRVDILVNNAAFTNQSRSNSFAADFVDYPLTDWQDILAVNLTGSFLGCQVIGKRMLAQRGGSIINMASLYGLLSPNHRVYPGTGISQPVAYSVSKAGVIALTRYLAALWGDQGVRVNCITPGGVLSGHNHVFQSRYRALCPMGRMADRTEMRGALVYLASEASTYVTGHNLVVDGGWTVW